MELINTRRPDDAAAGYSTILRWPLSVGYRHRPRQGCTCGNPACPVPGAHPDPDSPVFAEPQHLIEELEKAPGAGLIAWTASFDAVALPRTLGTAVMVALDQIAQVPSIVTPSLVILLVLPATGRYAKADRENIEVRSGPDSWIALPPSYDTRWDTLPWVPWTNTPTTLLHGADVGRRLDTPASPAELAR
ncbi:hypothetical protein ACWC5I_19690 [Kitasatospora sp. NPDC001574]